MRKVAVLLCLCAVLGCVRRPVPEFRPSPVSFVDERIRDASESISRDMSILAGSSQNRDYGYERGQGSLYSHMDMTWDGPLEGAVRKVASVCGFRVEIKGKAPQTPVIVHVKAVDRPCLAILRDIGMMTGPREGVIVNESENLIIIKYTGEK